MSQALKSSDDRSSGDPAAESSALQKRILVICGRVDPVIVSDELEGDIVAILGSSEDVTFETVDAGHDFPATRSVQVVHLITDFWKRSAQDGTSIRCREKPSGKRRGKLRSTYRLL